MRMLHVLESQSQTSDLCLPYWDSIGMSGLISASYVQNGDSIYTPKLFMHNSCVNYSFIKNAYNNRSFL